MHLTIIIVGSDCKDGDGPTDSVDKEDISNLLKILKIVSTT